MVKLLLPLELMVGLMSVEHLSADLCLKLCMFLYRSNSFKTFHFVFLSVTFCSSIKFSLCISWIFPLWKIYQNLKQDFSKIKSHTIQNIHIPLSQSLPSTYLAPLSGKGVLSPTSLQQNGFKLKIIKLMSLNTICTPLTTHNTLVGYFKLHPHAC